MEVPDERCRPPDPQGNIHGGQPVEHFPLCLVSREVSEQGAFRRVFPEFFQAGLKIRPPPRK